MPWLALGRLVSGSVFSGLKRFFVSKKGVFALLALIGINLVTWAFLSAIVDQIAQYLVVDSFPQGTFGYFAIQMILLAGLDEYASIVLGALSLKLTLESLKLRLIPGSQMNLF